MLPCSWHKPGSGPASVVATLSWHLHIINVRVWLQCTPRIVTSSCPSATKESSSWTWSHLPQASLQSLSLSGSISLHVPQLEIWVVVCLNRSLLPVAALVYQELATQQKQRTPCFAVCSPCCHVSAHQKCMFSSFEFSEDIYPRIVQSEVVSH